MCMLATGIARARAPPSARMSSLTRPGFQPAPLHTAVKRHLHHSNNRRCARAPICARASTSGRGVNDGSHDGSHAKHAHPRSRVVPRVHARRIEAMSGSHDEEDADEENDEDDAGPSGSPRSLLGSMDPNAPLGVVLTHVSADFDTLSSAVGLAKLRNARLGANCTFVVLPRGASPGVSHYLALHKNKFPIKEKRVVDADALDWAAVVDAQRRDRIGDCAEWLDAASEVVVLDHHLLATSDIDADELIVEQVGATATIVAEMLENENVPITEEDATLLALGIHTDTGSLTFEATTPRDANGELVYFYFRTGNWTDDVFCLFTALAYCLRMGASQKVLAEYVNPSLTADQREVIARGMTDVVKVVSQGITVSRVHVECDEYSPGMATCAKEVLDLTDSDALFMAVSYVHGKKNPYRHVSVIGRAKPVKTVDLGALLKESLKGGGHPKAASAAFRMDQPIASSDELERARVEGDVDGILDELVRRVCAEQVPPERKASDVMRRSSNVVSARPEMTMAEVGEFLERSGHRACPVISTESGVLMGVVSVTEVDVATIKGQLDRPVSGYMKLRSAVTPDTPVSECERILVEQGEGCIPVVANYEAPRRQWVMAGLVTRATILKTHEYYRRNRLRSRNGLVGERDESEKAAPKVTVNPEVFFDAEMLGLADNTKAADNNAK